MKTTKLLILFLGLIFTTAQAQTTASVDTGQPAVQESLVEITANALNLEPLTSVPRVTGPFCFWVVVPGGVNGLTFLPYPCLPPGQNFPIWSILPGSQEYLLDGTAGQVLPAPLQAAGANSSAMMASAVDLEGNYLLDFLAQIQETQAAMQMSTAMGVGLPNIPVFGGGGNTNGGDGGGIGMATNYPHLTINSNLLWLQITNISDGTVYANMYQATDYVYAVWSTTDLSIPFPLWQVETEVFPTNTNCMPFTVSQSGRQDLFLRAEDWTGVSANGNVTELWWLYYYFGNAGLQLSDTNLDVWSSNTLVFDYTNGIAPTDYYGGILPGLQSINGDQQSGPLGAFLPQPLVVQVTDGYGMGFSLSNAPITFSASSGLNQLAATNGGTLVTNLNVTTDGNGLAEAWLFLPTNAPEVNYVTVTAQSGPYAEQLLLFTAYEGEVAAPNISPAGGAFTVIQSVAVSCSTTGAIMHYTLDGSDPTEDDPAATNGQCLMVPWTATLNVAAFDDAILLPSEAQSATFTIIHPLVAGREHTLILNPDETILAAGSNGSGQLGDGSTTDRTNLVGVLNMTNAVGIAAGALHSLAWAADGTAWAWGDDTYGQLGDGISGGQQSSPVQVTNLVAIVQMAGGYQHSLALDANNNVWAWGNNDSGQLGDGTTTPQVIPEQLNVLSNIVEIAAGGGHSLALAADESVRAWGNNNYGQIGDGTSTEQASPVIVGGLTNAVAIAAGFNHSLALASDETVRAWGDNTYGQLGEGTFTERNQPVQVLGVSNIVAIAAGEYHNLALKSDGTVWSWGYNSHGQLGDGTTTTRTTPVPVSGLSNVLAITAGWAHSAALKSDGTVVVWGSIPYGLNGDASISFSTVPVTEEPSVLVNWGPPTITVQPFSQEVLAGDDVSFNVVATGTNLTYQWDLEGSPIPGATASVYTLNNVQSGGNYTVTVGTGLDSVVSSNAVLTVDAGTGDPHLMVIQGQRFNYTFKSGVTYYVWSPVQLYGKTVIRGGSVIKFDYNNEVYNNGLPATLQVLGSLHCQTEAYNLAELTSVDDDASGEFIYWASSGPLSYYGGYPEPMPTGAPYLDLSALTNATLDNCRIAYADEGVATPSGGRLDVWDGQFLQCNSSVLNQAGGTNAFHNVLFAGCGDAVRATTTNFAITAEHVTADVTHFWDATNSTPSVCLTNSIVLGGLGAASMQNTFVKPSPTNFQATGVGNYYLAANSPLHNAGSMNISPRLLSEFQKKTTYPPMSVPAMMQLSGNMLLCPQAPRYTNGAPDIGYFYDALDYTVADMVLTGGTLTVAPGTAVGIRMEYYIGFDLQNNSTFVSQGTPNKPNVFVDVQSVQEQFAFPAFAAFVPDFFPDASSNSAPPTLNFRFSRFYMNYMGVYFVPAYHFWSGISAVGFEWSVDSAMNFTLRDCQVHGGQVDLGLPDNPDPYIGFGLFPLDYVYGSGAVSWLNNSFDNVTIGLAPTYNQFGTNVEDNGLNVDLAFVATNNLFRGGDWFYLEPIQSSSGNWVFADNLFDKVDFLQDTNQSLDYNYNGYWPLQPSELQYPGYDASQLQPTATGDATTDGGNEPVLTNAPPYQVGPFGKFYLPTNTPLYGAASDTAANLGLFHYTTRKDQVKEGNDVAAGKPNASIGLHYIAATNGMPMDFDGDGIPDYVENWNGDGNYPAHVGVETDWQNPMTDGVTPDPYSTIYDAIDLDADGLTGAEERFFGTNPLIPDNPLNMTSVQHQSVLSGIVQIPLNINTNIDPNTTLLLNVNEDANNSFVYQANGQWFAAWDTSAVANGVYRLQMEYPVDNFNSAFSETLFVNVQNAVCFPNDIARCGTGLFTQPQTINTNGTYTADIYDDQTNLVSEVNGGVDSSGFCLDPESGEEGITISLVDTNGNELPSTYFTVDVSTFPPAQQSQFRPKLAPPGGHGKRNFGHEGPWNGQRGWIMAYMPIYNSGTVGASDLNDVMANAGAQVINRYGSELILNGQSTTASGYASAMTLQTSQDWNILMALLGDDSSRNIYYYGHAGKSLIGSMASHYITGEQLQFILHSSANLMSTNGNSHFYRFVFLDGCYSSAGDLPLDFSIDKKKIPDTVWNKAGIPARAFLGWASTTGTSFQSNGTIIYDYNRMRFMNNFWQDWGGNNPTGLQDALQAASADNDSNGQRFCEFDNEITKYGSPTLPFYQ